jgi:PAS domain S-box-containing protein
MWNTLISGNTWQGEFINKRKNGEIFYENAIIVPVTDELGKNAFYLAVKIDITEQKKAYSGTCHCQGKSRGERQA